MLLSKTLCFLLCERRGCSLVFSFLSRGVSLRLRLRFLQFQSLYFSLREHSHFVVSGFLLFLFRGQLALSLCLDLRIIRFRPL